MYKTAAALCESVCWSSSSSVFPSPAGGERTLSLFNIDRDSVDRFLELLHDDSVLSACVSSDGRLLASGAADQLIRVTD